MGYVERFKIKKEEILEQKAAFDALDIDKSGGISLAEIVQFNAKFKGGFSEDDLKSQFKELDVDGNGLVTFVEYLKVFVKGTYGREVNIGLDSLESVPQPVAAQASSG